MVQNPYNTSISAIVNPGSRTLELSQSSVGNPLSLGLLTELKDYLKIYQDNTMVGTIIMASENKELFSQGLVMEELRENRNVVLLELAKVATRMNHYKKPIVSVLGGEMTGTTLGLFSNAKYRLATPETRVRLDEIVGGFVPCGGLAWHMVRGSDMGKAMARYLAISQREITGMDLFQLGLATHLTESEPHDALTFALEHTHDLDLAETKYRQEMTVDVGTLESLIDTMHMECDVDVLSHKAWDDVMLVSPREADEEARRLGLVEEEEVDEMELTHIASAVKDIFQDGDWDTCYSRLAAMEQPWAQEAASLAPQLNRHAVEAWFSLTELAGGVPIEKATKIETEMNSELIR